MWLVTVLYSGRLLAANGQSVTEIEGLLGLEASEAPDVEGFTRCSCLQATDGLAFQAVRT